MRRNTYMMLLAFILTACLKNSNSKIVTECINNRNSLEYAIDSVVIELDSISRPYYFGKIDLLETDSELMFLAYNSKTNTIDWFDLIRKDISHTPLNVDGPEAIREVNAIYAISIDSIVVASYKYFYIIDRKGNIISKVNTAIENNNGKKGLMSSTVNIGMQFDPLTLDIYTGVNYTNNEDNKSQPRAVKFNIRNLKYSFLPVYYSSEYNENYNKLGYSNNFSMSFYENILIYNFDYSSDFYTYNYNKGESSQIKSLGNSAAKKFEFSNLNPNEQEKMKLYVFNPLFNLPIMSKNNYFRFSWTGVSSSLGIDGKRIILSKYAPDFSSYSETEINNKIYYFGSEMPVKDGFVMIAQHSSTPNIDFEKIKFHIFRFK